MNQAILRLPKVIAVTGLSRSSIYRRIADGAFPQPIPLGRRSVGWLDADVDAWICRQAASRVRAIGQAGSAA